MNMRHRGGIDLAPPVAYAVDLHLETLGSSPQIFVSGAFSPSRCSRRVAWNDVSRPGFTKWIAEQAQA